MGAERGGGEAADRKRSVGVGVGIGVGVGGRREMRRERLRMKGRMGIVEKTGGSFGNLGGDEGDEDRTVENCHRPHSPVSVGSRFPGREGLIKKVLERKRFL